METEFVIKSNIKEIKQATDQAIERALEVAGGMAESFAKDNLTSFPRVDTGNLRNSVTHKVNNNDNECFIGSAVEYAPYVEYGTGIYADGGGRQTPWFYEDAKGVGHFTHGMKPSHFLKNALSEHKEEYRKAIIGELQDAMKG